MVVIGGGFAGLATAQALGRPRLAAASLCESPSTSVLISTLMETIVARVRFETAHRQPGYPGVCRFVHGSTWQGTIAIAGEQLPRDAADLTVDGDELRQVLRAFDHRVVVADGDRPFMDAANFEPEGVLLIAGKAPTAENLAVHVVDTVVAYIERQFPRRGQPCTIEVTIAESPDDVFCVSRVVARRERTRTKQGCW